MSKAQQKTNIAMLDATDIIVQTQRGLVAFVVVSIW
jgi:hypothetical protein